MLSCVTDSIKTYGFRFQDDSLTFPVQLVSVGHEHRFDSAYSWHGLKRSEDACLFQYTVSGFGEIQSGGSAHRLSRENAFLVQIPSDHHYYLPAYSEGWEFYWIMLTGPMVVQVVEQIADQHGVIHSFGADSDVIKSLKSIFEFARKGHINDGFHASVLAYEFTFELFRSIRRLNARLDTCAAKIAVAVSFIGQHYRDPISVDDIAQWSGLSKYHFMHRFREQTGYTPVQYLTKVRIEHAAQLLQLSGRTIEDIAHDVGYANSNYLCKIFRKYVGCTPGAFRKGTSFVSTSKLTIGI